MQGPKIETLKTVLSGTYLRRSLMTSALVGTVLNIINQGDAMLTGAGLNVFKLGLTYCVPFCVASYASWMTLQDQ